MNQLVVNRVIIDTETGTRNSDYVEVLEKDIIDGDIIPSYIFRGRVLELVNEWNRQSVLNNPKIFYHYYL